MRTVRFAFLLAILTHAATALAATSYTVTIERHGDGLAKNQTYSVVALDGRVRATLSDHPADTPVMYDALLWPGSGPAVALNSQNETWYGLAPVTPFALMSRYLSPAEKASVKKVTVQLNTPAVVDGRRHYTGRIAYDVHIGMNRDRVKISCVAVFQITTTDSIGRNNWLGQLLPVTGYADVDEKLSAAEASIEGFPVHLSLDATRTYAGGAPMRDSVDVRVSDVKQIAVTPSLFTRPASYRHQPPVIGTPAR